MNDLADKLAGETIAQPKNNVWYCKVGFANNLPQAADGPMRAAIRQAYHDITGEWPQFTFSGWGQQLTEPELAVVENRLPSEEHYAAYRAKQIVVADGDALEEAVEALRSIAEYKWPQIIGHHEHKWCVPETGNEYTARDPIPKETALGALESMKRIARAFLTRMEARNG